MKRLLLLLPFALLATVNEPFCWELSSGYRTDEIHWHSSQDASSSMYTEKYDNVQFWENALSFRVIHRDLMFFIAGGYSAFGNGTLQQQFTGLPFTNDTPQFNFTTNGFAADGTGYFGYAVNLTADRTYKVLLIPLFGFSGHFAKLNRRGTSVVETSSYQMSSTLPKSLEQTWYGIYLGAGVRIQPVGRLIFDVGYAYHWLHAKLSTHFAESVALPTPSSSFTQSNNLTASAGGNHGHSGWAKMECIASAAWRVGAASTINYFPSRVLNVQQKQTTTPPGSTASLSSKFKLRWTSISVLFTVSRDI